MKRRQLLGAGLAMTGAGALGLPPLRAAAEAVATRVRSGQPGWPADADWAALNQATNGHLAPVTTPPKLDASDAVKLLSNPFYIADQPALTESSGWLDAWRSSPSAYVVAAESAPTSRPRSASRAPHNLRLVDQGPRSQLPGDLQRTESR